MATSLRLGVVALLIGVLMTQGQSSALSGHPHPTHWREVRSLADFDQALARAQQEGKSLLVAWEAAGCESCRPPLESLGQRDDFVQLSRRFVAVHLNGPAPGLQPVVDRLHLRGDRSGTLLLSPDRDELTRLSSDLDANQYLGALRTAIGGSASRQPLRPLRQVVDDALTGMDLPPHEWRQLALYAWEDAPAARTQPREQARVLALLAQACPMQLRYSRARLLLQAAAAQAPGQTANRPLATIARDSGSIQGTATGAVSDVLRRSTAQALRRVFDDERSIRELIDLLTLRTPALLNALAEPGAPDTPLRSAWDQALQRLALDPQLSADQRLATLQARVDLARFGQPRSANAVPAALRDDIQRAVRQLSSTTSADPPDRTARAARLLAQVGLAGDADDLLRARLPRHGGAPELMGQLADNARLRGQFRDTVLWSRRAWEAAQGPALRLEWGSRYLQQLIELTPGESSLIDQVAERVIDDLAREGGALPEHSAASVRALTDHLLAWQVMASDDPGRLDRWAQQLQPACTRNATHPALRPGCDSLSRLAQRS